MPKDIISKELLDMLCCPETKAELVLDGETLVSTDEKTRYRYKITEGIPVLLVDEAEQLPKDEWLKIMQRHKRA
ncbi:MAG TPA: Trm112 family protein [Ignavibacteriales bacterium]|nr:Trm112 family protein [Ignavibacteriales bacterium]